MKNKILISAILIFMSILAIATISNADTANIKTYIYDAKAYVKDTNVQVSIGDYSFNHPAQSYDFFDENGKFNSVYVSADNVYWAKFDNNMKITSTVSFPLLYNLKNEKDLTAAASALTYNFGNAIYYNGYLYVMYSRIANYKTTEERAKEKVMAIAKYDKNGKMIKSNEFLGIDLNASTYYDENGTSVPFYASNCNLAANNGKIVCFFGRNMFNGHQASLMMFIDANTLEFESNMRNKNISKTDIRRYYYVYSHSISHSLGQRMIATSDGQFLMIESGDAGANGATRGLNLTKVYETYDSDVSQNILKKATKKMLHYSEGDASTWGYNKTYSALGNLIELSDGYMYIGGLEKTLSRAYGYTINEPWNLFVQKYSKDFYTKTSVKDMQLLKTEVRKASGTPATSNGIGRLYLTGKEEDYGIKWLTDLKNQSITSVRAVKMENENIIILWEQFDIKKSYYNGNATGYEPIDPDDRTMYYMIIDKNANIVYKPTIIEGKRMSAEEQYAYKDGKVYWTTVLENDNSKIQVNILDVKNPIKETAKPSYKLGDVNEDKVVDALDAREVLKYCVGKTKSFSSNQKLAADVNKDGAIDALDAREILKYCVGKASF